MITLMMVGDRWWVIFFGGKNKYQGLNRLFYIKIHIQVYNYYFIYDFEQLKQYVDQRVISVIMFAKFVRNEDEDFLV